MQCSNVIKELVHAFSCAYIELWMHLGSLESTQEARVTLGYHLEQLLRFSRALQTSRMHPYTHAKHEPILNYIIIYNTVDVLLVNNFVSDQV